MVISYLKLALRLMARHPFFTIINVTGIAIGVVVFFILWRYAQSELHSDDFHKDNDRIAALKMRVKYSTSPEVDWDFLHPLVGPIMKESFPEIEDYTRFIIRSSFEEVGITDHGKNLFFSYRPEGMDPRAFPEEEVFYADENFFRFFTFPLTYGSADRVLTEPNSIVLSRKTAMKYFGQELPLGKLLYLNDSLPLTVTGVFEDLPKNSSIRFNIVLSMNRISHLFQSLEPLRISTINIFRFKKNVDIDSLQPRFDRIFHDRFNSVMAKFFPGHSFKAWLSPMHDWRFSRASLTPKFYLNLLCVAAILVLLMAWINYVNLTISLTGRRTTELIARQVSGARLRDLIRQFLIESFTFNIIAVLLAFTALQFIKVPAEMAFGFYSPGIVSFAAPSYSIIILILLLGIVITGVYPAWIIMKRSSGNLLGLRETWKNKGPVGSLLRVIPYSAAVVLMIWTFTVYAQIHFILTKDLGFNTSEVIVLNLPDRPTVPASTISGFINLLKGLPPVEGYTVSHAVAFEYSIETLKHSNEMTQTNSFGGVDERFIPFYGIKLLAGRNFGEDQPANMNSIIISKKAAAMLGFAEAEQALGEKVLIENIAYSLEKMVPVEVIGIIDDYSPYPLFDSYINNERGSSLTYSNKVGWHRPLRLSMHIKVSDFEETIESIRTMYAEYFGGHVFHWYFLDDNILEQYINQRTMRNQVMFFSIVAIVIACLGLLGMISNRVVEKTKEIGIRKVLGARLLQIAQLLLNSSFRQFMLAVGIGIPTGWYLTQQFLEKFSERIELQWWHFAGPVVVLIIIMLSVVTGVVWKAARSNPVEALKHE